MGERAGDSNLSGNSNIFIGRQAGGFNRAGNFNTALGDQADVMADSLVNATALGYQAKVDISNKVRIGNSNVRIIEGQVAFSFPSDRRVKENIQPLELGLPFLLSMKPVAYHRISNGEKDLEMGFIAQEIKESLEHFSSENYGMITTGSDQLLTVRFNDLLAPMVKGIQELHAENELLKSRINELEKMVLRLVKDDKVMSASTEEKP